MDGFYIGYKNIGISSSKFVLNISKNLKVKAGHTGTLDVEAEGIMIVALGQATKYVQFFNQLEKVYEAEGILGITTDTKDIHGNILSQKDANAIDCDTLKEALKCFVGNIRQIPPIYSAKKIKGKKAYSLARSGLEVKLKPIDVKIYSIELLKCCLPKFYIGVTVSSGTYIRTLIEDIGNVLNVGATTNIIKRTQIGKFDNAYVDKILDISEGLYFIKSLELDFYYIKSLKQGKTITVPNIEDGIYKLLSKDKNFYGIVSASNDVIRALRMQS